MTCDKCNCENVYVLDSNKDIIKNLNHYPLLCPECKDIRLYDIELKAYVFPQAEQVIALRKLNENLIEKIERRRTSYRMKKSEEGNQDEAGQN